MHVTAQQTVTKVSWMYCSIKGSIVCEVVYRCQQFAGHITGVSRAEDSVNGAVDSVSGAEDGDSGAEDGVSSSVNGDSGAVDGDSGAVDGVSRNEVPGNSGVNCEPINWLSAWQLRGLNLCVVISSLLPIQTALEILCPSVYTQKIASGISNGMAVSLLGIYTECGSQSHPLNFVPSCL